jgi:hypothetical protein
MKTLKSYLWIWISFFLLLPTSLFSIDVGYSYVPKKVYEKQVFPISFLSTTAQKNIKFHFQGEKKPILKDPVVIKNGEKTFYTFYFKTVNTPFQIPSVLIEYNGKKRTLPGVNIPVEPLPEQSNFSGVIASGLKIKNYQASIYDERNNLIALSLEAHDANLEDMYIPDALKDGLENLKRTGSKMEAQYYIVLPSTQTMLKFSYYDTIKESFVEKSIPITIDEGSVAAQTDLNPKDDSFERLKKYSLLGLIIFFLLLFIWKRDFFYLIIAVVTTAILLTFFIPLKKICIKAGSPIYIIPTSNSRISLHIDQELKTTQLGRRGEFTKIEYNKGVVGWIKDDDVCQN